MSGSYSPAPPTVMTLSKLSPGPAMNAFQGPLPVASTRCCIAASSASDIGTSPVTRQVYGAELAIRTAGRTLWAALSQAAEGKGPGHRLEWSELDVVWSLGSRNDVSPPDLHLLLEVIRLGIEID